MASCLSSTERSALVWRSYAGRYSAVGCRDVLLVASYGPFPVANPAVIPRCEVRVAERDCRKLRNQGLELPVDSYQDDLAIVRARIELDDTLELVGEEISEPENLLSKDHVVQRIENVLRATRKAGVILYYCGHGGKYSGDWCFFDGVITFQEIMSLYVANMRGGALTIVSDCSYSGKWVKECCDHLDDLGVRPCGHSAAENGILVKVYTSCRSTDVAAAPCFSVSCTVNDKNNGTMSYYLGRTLRETQHACGIDFTRLICNNTIDRPCSLNPAITSWKKKSEGSRIRLIRGNDRSNGKKAWHYVLLKDDESIISEFEGKVKSGTVDVEKYGEILKSGFGQDPPNEVKDSIEKNYSTIYT